MVGWLVPETRPGRRTELARTLLMGLTVLRAGVPVPPNLREKTLLRRIGRTAALLERAGVRRVLTPPSFPYWAILRSHGLYPISPEIFCQAMAPRLAMAALAERGVPAASGTVALVGTRVNRPFFQTALALCPRVRTLVLDAPAGGADLADDLRREYGAAALSPEAGLTAQVTVCFSPERAVCGGTLALYGPAPDLAGLSLGFPEGEPPPEAEALPLLSLLWEAGRISTEEIPIISSPVNGQLQTN